jgi:hypothetical protein
MFINPLCIFSELGPMAGPLLFCGEMAKGWLNRLNVEMTHPNRDRGSTGRAISTVVKGNSGYGAKSGDPLNKINE